MVIGDYQYGGRSILWVNREELSSHCKCGQRRQMLSSNSFHLFGPNLLFLDKKLGHIISYNHRTFSDGTPYIFKLSRFTFLKAFSFSEGTQFWFCTKMNIYHVFLLDFPFLIDLFVCGVRFVWEKLGSVLIQETCVGFSTATTPGTRQVLYLYLYLYLRNMHRQYHQEGEMFWRDYFTRDQNVKEGDQ